MTVSVINKAIGAGWSADVFTWYFELFVDTLIGPGGFFARFVHWLQCFITLHRLASERNPDGLLPIIAVSYVRRASATPASAAPSERSTCM